MKFIIFADKSYNYVKPLADGLHRTLMEEGHECHIWYDGNFWLNKLNMFNVLFSVFAPLLAQQQELQSLCFC